MLTALFIIRRTVLLVGVVTVTALLLFGGGPLAHAATFTVNSAADAVGASLGACTLRATIMEANAP